MYDSFIMQELQAKYNSSCEKPYNNFSFTCLFFRKGSIFYQMKSQITSADQIHDEIEILSILKCVESIYEVLIFQTF